MDFFLRKNSKQLKAVFKWLSTVINKNDLILVDEKGRHEVYYFKFPLKFGDKPKKAKKFNKDNLTFFVKFSSRQVEIDKNEWLCIFRSPDLKIYENKKRIQRLQFRPLHHGLNEEEKRLALEIARKAVSNFLKEKKRPSLNDFALKKPLPQIFYSKVDLDIAIWTKGQLRGSWVVENKILGEGIIEAAISTSRDSRFKPLEVEELSSTLIEITLLSDLKIPISQNFIHANRILHDKGYLLKNAGKKGWFLPNVFNVSKFKDLKDFLFRLASEKAFLPAESIYDRKTEIYIFEVQDFIEESNNIEILDLDGPVVVPKTKNIVNLEEATHLAARWLLNIQEPNGNFPPIFNPISGETTQIDWPRSAFCSWSLIEYGKAAENLIAIESGKKNFFYLKKFVLEEDILIDQNKAALTLAYLGRGALSLGYQQEALRCGHAILKKEKFLKFEPILFHQIGSFFADLSKFDKSFFESAISFGKLVNSNFQNNLDCKKAMSLAIWAGLAELLLKLFEMTKDRSFLENARKTAEWLLEGQLDCGAFKSAADSEFPYTRGTGKVTEILTELLDLREIDDSIDWQDDIIYYEQCIKRSLEWLITMQYSRLNSYFIPEKNLKNTIGGFRHDYFNFDLWIDSAGHFILAASSFLKARLLLK